MVMIGSLDIGRQRIPDYGGCNKERSDGRWLTDGTAELAAEM